MAKPPPVEPQTRRTIQFPDRMWSDIAEFRVAEMIGNDSEALRLIVREYLAAWRKRRPTHKPAPKT